MNYRPRLWERLVAPLILALAVACFALPFLSVSVDLRHGDATGIQLIRGDADWRGRYVHASYRGEAETLVKDGRVPAAVALAFALAGLAVGWLPRGWSFRLGLAAAALGLLSLLAFLLATSPAQFQTGTVSDRRYGLWLAGALLVAAGVWCITRLRKGRVILFD